MVPDRKSGDETGGADSALRSAVIEDPAAQAAMQPWIRMECFQLGRGKRVGLIDCADLGTRQIVRERQSVAVQKIGITPPNLCTISCCTPAAAFRFSQLGSGEGEQVYFMPGNTEFDIHVPAGARTTYITFDQDELLREARAFAPEDWEREPEDLMRLPGAKRQAFESVANRWLGTMASGGAAAMARNADSMRRMMMQDVLNAVSGSSGEQPATSDRGGTFRVCNTARKHMEERLMDDSPPTIAEVCRHVGVSERTLQYAFRTYVDMSPLSYLRACRLNRVRSALLCPGDLTTVTEAATRYGFFHLGKFANHYRLHFGESPSSTLARGLRPGS